MSNKNELAGLVTGLVALIAVAVFFLVGFTAGHWELIWLVFLAVPVTAIIFDIVTRNKDISGSIIGIVAILASGAFLLLGFLRGMWHPAWLVFLTIPIAAIIADAIKKKDLIERIIALVAVLCAGVYVILSYYLDLWGIAWLIFLLIPITSIIINIIKVAKKGSEETKAE